MKPVTKHTTFNSLKSTENKIMKSVNDLKKHLDFEKVIIEIRLNKNLRNNQSNPKA